MIKNQTCPEYRTWAAMIQRCTNPNNVAWKNYGGRGITVCERWRHSFENFFSDMGLRPGPEYTIDRTDNDGNYEPSNCAWRTRSDQQQNRRPLPRKLDSAAQSQVINRYVLGESTESIAKAFGVNIATIRRLIPVELKRSAGGQPRRPENDNRIILVTVDPTLRADFIALSESLGMNAADHLRMLVERAVAESDRADRNDLEPA